MVGGSAAPAPALLKGAGLKRQHGRRRVLDVDRIEVRPGEVLAIVGPNGAGKSTLFRTLLLLERPDAGTVEVSGVSMRPRDARARGQLAGVFQRPILFTGSVQSNVEFGLRAAGLGRAERRRRALTALEWLDLVALADRPVHTLSGGEAQRVALARALVLEPLVVLLDEPTSSLDVAARRAFRRDLERVARQHARGVVLITHDAAEAFSLADRIAVMQDGRVVQEGSPDEIMLAPGTPFIAELTGAELLLHGTVVRGEENLAVIAVTDDVELWSAVREPRALRPGESAVVAYRPEDVVLAHSGGEHTSAVNRIPGRVEAVVPVGALTRVRLRAAGDLVLTALVTRRSAESLGLSPGTVVTAQMKATALHAWGREDSTTRLSRGTPR